MYTKCEKKLFGQPRKKKLFFAKNTQNLCFLSAGKIKIFK
jgi:hypothetical protein